MSMPLRPSGIIKPLIWFLWYVSVVVLIVHVFKGQISIEGALLKGGAYLALILAWTIGLHQYLFSFFSPSSSFFTHLKGLFNTLNQLTFLSRFIPCNFPFQ